MDCLASLMEFLSLYHLLMKSAFFHFSSRTAQAIIFVLDSSDDYRMVVAKDELDILLQHSGECTVMARSFCLFVATVWRDPPSHHHHHHHIYLTLLMSS